MPLTRRHLIASGLLLPFASHRTTSAIDMDWATSAIVHVFDMLPDRPGPDGLDFPVTTGIDHLVRKNVWSENPEMYWDPEGEDYLTIFGFHPSMLTLSASQGDVSIWKVNNTTADLAITRETLESNGWEMVDDDLGILHYSGSDDERAELSASLNILQDLMREGTWDWVALPDVATIVVGSNEELVRQVADRAKNYSVMSAIGQRFHGLKPLLTPETYIVTLLPPQSLPVSATSATFVSKSWTGDEPIAQSIGLQLESSDLVETTIDSIKQRLDQEISPVTGERYSDHLELFETRGFYSSVRLDFIDQRGDWDVTRAWVNGDLGFLPLE